MFFVRLPPQIAYLGRLSLSLQQLLKILESWSHQLYPGLHTMILFSVKLTKVSILSVKHPFPPSSCQENTHLLDLKLTYCSQIWHPYLLKDITTIEQLQRRATKFICNNYTIDYKQCLLNLNMLPLMYQLDFLTFFSLSTH